MKSFWKASSLFICVLAVYIYYCSKDLNAFLNLYDIVNLLDSKAEYFNRNENRYLLGNFAPVGEENFNVPLEIIEGEIPANMSGLFLRVGPNPIPHHMSRRYHWFDGHGMIHSVRFKDQQALYSNQWIRSPRFNLEQKLDRPVFTLFGEFKGFLGLFKILFVLPTLSRLIGLPVLESGQANTAMMMYNKKIYACHEGSLPFEIRWNQNNSFDSIGYETFGNVLNYPVTAHSKVDPVVGDLYINGYGLGPGMEQPAKIGAVDASDVVQSYFGLDLPVRPWMHDSMITENFVLIFESSAHLSPEGIINGEVFKMNKTHNLRIGVLPKTGSTQDEITWFAADRHYILIHAMNAYEEVNTDGELEVVLWAPLGDDFDGTLVKDSNKYYLSELRMNMGKKDNKLQITKVGEHNVEFPRVHPHFLGRPSKFGFVPVMGDEDAMFYMINKYDLQEKTLVGQIVLPKGCITNEPIPIPKDEDISHPKSSDEVWLGLFVYNGETGAAEYHIYDGESMSSSPVTRLRVPKRVPYGFHSEWFGEKAMQAHLMSA